MKLNKEADYETLLRALLSHRQLFEEMMAGDGVPTVETVVRHYDICDEACCLLIDANVCIDTKKPLPWKGKKK